jgi:hypothetical protein
MQTINPDGYHKPKAELAKELRQHNFRFGFRGAGAAGSENLLER